jgi:hypothetical protein
VVLATGRRVLLQLRGDPRTLALLLLVPCVLEALIKWVFEGTPVVFQRVGVPLVGIFPLISMFLVTSIAMLRERTTGTLERLMSMPLAKLDLLAGYGLAFAAMATLQAVLVSFVAVGLLDLEVAGSTSLVVVFAVLNALLGMALRPVSFGLCAHRVSGGAVHAGVPAAADPAVRTAGAARSDGAAAGADLLSAAHDLRLRRAVAGGGLVHRQRRGVARRRDPGRRDGAIACTGRRHTAAAYGLTRHPSIGMYPGWAATRASQASTAGNRPRSNPPSSATFV